MKAKSFIPDRLKSLNCRTISDKTLVKPIVNFFGIGLAIGSVLLATSQKSACNENPNSLYTIVNAINNNPSKTKKIVADLSDYDKRAVALALVRKNYDRLALVIEDFAIESSYFLYEIATALQDNSPMTLALYIGNFKNMDSSYALHLAKNYLNSNYIVGLCANNLVCLRSYLNHVHMNQDDRLSLASKVLAKDPEFLNSSIKHFQIEDEEMRYRIALDLIDRCPSALASSIKPYNLSKNHLKEIAFLLLDKSPEILASHIQDYHLDQIDLKKIASAILDTHPEILMDAIEGFDIQDVHFVNEIKQNASIKTLETEKTYIKIDDIIKNRNNKCKKDEYERLLSDNRIAKSLEEISKYEPNLTIEEKIGIGQSIELRERLKDKYYVINHGENNHAIIVNIVAKKAKELFEEKKNKFWEVLRHEAFYQDANSKDVKILDVHSLKYQVGRSIDSRFRDVVISGDIVFENTIGRESAISFYHRETNMLFQNRDNDTKLYDPKPKENLIKKIIEFYFSDENNIEELLKKLMDISNVEGGTLYSICIPKKKLFSIGYASHPGGSAWHETLTLEDIDSYQNGIFTDGKISPDLDVKPYTKKEYSYRLKDYHEVTCDEIFTIRIPQFRLFTKKLKKEDGIFIIPHSTLSAEKMNELEKAVEILLLEAKQRELA